ncbi:hypothetical protein SAMN04487968_10642 [Nocardioides terrae]|uniref:Uncharacterized protein n=1 Tax=Nocardioides terrae TaxID=574651 RepID=A0A1I1IWE3_9ACTN|nr:hypothetical protein [Nocardioides terrae]SFC38648.1 hypothetical protein SAMN04487968_10642 [Nocardioides terrae]
MTSPNSEAADRDELTREHFDAVHFELTTEIRRLRGEIIALRDEMHTSQGKVLKAVEQMRGLVRRLAGRTDDLWRADRGVARLVKRGEAKGAPERGRRDSGR